MIKDLVSIVIPAYNASNYLAEAIDSALAQSYQNVEIIVVNDGSNDNEATRDVALSYGNKIRYFEKKNGGSSSAINYGITQMKGEWFSWLSHDDLYMPDKIKNELLYLDKLGISQEEYSKHVLFSACELISANGAILRKDSEKDILAMNKEVENIKGNEYFVAQPRRYTFHGCSCLIHKNVFKKIGMFDENLRILNDVEMWFRIYTEGYIIHYVPEILVKGRIHSKQVSYSIGFSAKHPENDILWPRRLKWLQDNRSNNYQLFMLFGKNAYLSTRTADGDRAFAIAMTINPQKAVELWIRKNFYKLYACIRTMVKKIILKYGV